MRGITNYLDTNFIDLLRVVILSDRCSLNDFLTNFIFGDSLSLPREYIHRVRGITNDLDTKFIDFFLALLLFEEENINSLPIDFDTEFVDSLRLNLFHFW